VSGCATTSGSRPHPPALVAGAFKLYDGPVLGDDQVALLDWQTGGGQVLRIDDHPVDERARQAAVLPGRHTIQYLGAYGGSVLRGPAVRRVGPLIARLELQAGHVYLVKAERQGDWRWPSLYLWIEDAPTGAVLHGEKPLP
jgi:hypothetical protein